MDKKVWSSSSSSSEGEGLSRSVAQSMLGQRATLRDCVAPDTETALVSLVSADSSVSWPLFQLSGPRHRKLPARPQQHLIIHSVLSGCSLGVGGRKKALWSLWVSFLFLLRKVSVSYSRCERTTKICRRTKC